MKQKLLSLFFVMLLATGARADGVEINGIYYVIDVNDNYAAVTSSPDRYSGEITIPSSVNYEDVDYPVKFIFSYAFSQCPELTSITIPNSVTSIGIGAFSGCVRLESLTLGTALTIIGDQAFSGCRALSEVTIPASVTGIRYHAFEYCSGLTSIKVEEGNPQYDSRENCNAIIVTSTNKLLLASNNTFIPASVTSIDERAFYSCRNLTSITIPNSVTEIGEQAFYSCTGLTSISIPESVTAIGKRAFAACENLTSIDVAEGNTVYDSRENCNAIIASESNRLITGCMNTTVPSSVTSIEDCAFEFCTGLRSANIPESVTEIGGATFAGCENMTSVSLPSSITSIGYSAFYGCYGLTSITIPAKVNSIGSWAFMGCTGLTDVYTLRTDAASYNAVNDAFYANHAANATLHVPAGCKEAYASTAPWSFFGSIVDDIQVGIGAIDAVMSKGSDAVFNLQGQRIAQPQHGVNILRYPDGTGRKVLVK
ncbi:MAG: leucine-rich repeat domain-containing protein [Alloprevotella sp.]|nr:leucine-rich repeat domain-containing protein [Alloprevotella sp.]